MIGNYCAIDESASIGRYTVLGNNVIAKEFCETNEWEPSLDIYNGIKFPTPPDEADPNHRVITGEPYDPRKP